jgi:multidrug resistance efflux pump
MKSYPRRLMSNFGRPALTLLIVAVALTAGRWLWNCYEVAPWTRDGRVRADVVTIAPDVSGLVSAVLVHDNQPVKRGDVLFRIDPDRFELALDQADAAVASRKAQMDEAQREAVRYERLSQLSVSQETQEQRLANAEATAAAYRQAVADRAVAELNLRRSVVISPVDGTVTNFALEPGDYVVTGKPVLALVDSATLRIEGYFEETKLPEIHRGDRVEVRLMGESQVLMGHVDSIAAGIADRERTDSPDLLANINPTFNWVRLAQRVPVRIRPDSVPPGMELVVGRTATVTVEPGTAASRISSGGDASVADRGEARPGT